MVITNGVILPALFYRLDEKEVKRYLLMLNDFLLTLIIIVM